MHLQIIITLRYMYCTCSSFLLHEFMITDLNKKKNIQQYKWDTVETALRTGKSSNTSLIRPQVP